MKIFRKEEDSESPATEIEELRDAVPKAHMPTSVERVALKEIDRLSKMNPSTTEYTIGFNYLDYLISLPWNAVTEDNLDLKRAEAVLEEDHYGLHEIKNRILEHLSVRILRNSRKHNILVVDDEKMTRLNLEHVLVKDGYHVTTAATGTEALEYVEKDCFDVIITDLKMEQVDGMGVLSAAKTRQPDVEVIIITGYATVTSAVEAMRKGSHHYLAKPFKLDEIRSTVDGALKKKRLALAQRGPIICFIGPPGTGKTSLGLSIARSLERKFIRISLAGIRDEAEIRGHRRSYVGALPGRIIQEIRRAGVRNPVIMLDEIDKIGQDFKGDPSSALLELLDPEQNSGFMDHYLDVPFDLSMTMFLGTANTTDSIPEPLLDRLEVLPLSGYTEEEKEKIAFTYLIPREVSQAGLGDAPPVFTPEAIRKIIREYSREAGLRNLQRQIAAVCRKIARETLQSGMQVSGKIITPEAVEAFLGPRKFFFEGMAVKERIGVATGLAWTKTGGEIIFVEATKMKGKNQLILTGSLGEVMKESAQAALSYIRSHTELFAIPENFFDNNDIHIHVPAGAIPKDGPSAGLTIAVALISLLTNRPCRRDVAVTGELTLSGRILPVGGVKEKVLAAQRARLKSVIFPTRNEPDLKDLPKEVKKDLDIRCVDEVKEIADKVLQPWLTKEK